MAERVSELIERLRELQILFRVPDGCSTKLNHVHAQSVHEALGQAADALSAPAQIEPVAIGEVMNKPDNEIGTLNWPRVVWKDGGAVGMPPVGTKLYASPVAQPEAVAPSVLKDFSDWAWNKDGDAIGNMAGQHAAREAWFAAAKLYARPAVELPPYPELRCNGLYVRREDYEALRALAR